LNSTNNSQDEEEVKFDKASQVTSGERENEEDPTDDEQSEDEDDPFSDESSEDSDDQTDDGEEASTSEVAGKVGHLQLDVPKSSYTLATYRRANAPRGCYCRRRRCSCCVHISMRGLNKRACAKIAYLPASLGFRLQLTLGNRNLFTKEVSVRNPPPLCANIPYLKKVASVCLYLYNVRWKKRIGGCVKIRVLVKGLVKKNFYLGCFSFNR